jgi:PAS domain-containing protein
MEMAEKSDPQARSAEEREAEILDLRSRLAEAEETIRAINNGEVDAVVVNGETGAKVYTLEGADHPYRVMVEQMQEGTVTLDPERLILYANPKFAAMIGTSGRDHWFAIRPFPGE